MTHRSEAHTSDRAPEPVGAFPHARRVGNLLFLSGIGPRTRGTSRIPGVETDAAGRVVSYDIEAQCRAVFENVRLVLEDAGAAAIVMHSLFEEQLAGEHAGGHPRNRQTESNGAALNFFRGRPNFRLDPDEHLEQLNRIKSAVGVPVIASLNGSALRHVLLRTAPSAASEKTSSPAPLRKKTSPFGRLP